MNRRSRTVIWGAVPLLALSYLISAPTVPFTSIPLTVPYAAEGPGPTYNTLADYQDKQIVHITGTDVDPTDGHLNMTTVSVRTQMALAQAMSRWLFSDDTLVPIETIFPPNMSQDEVNQQNQLAFSDSESAATLAAYTYLGRPTVIEVADVMPDAPAKDLVTTGDRIVKVDGVDVESPSKLRELVSGKNPGDTVTIGFAGGESREVKLGENPHTKKGYLGITMTSVPADNTKIEYNLEDIGGPSAGLMFSLAVVDKLSPGSLTGGKFIAGTGTIKEDGQVGPIGGITHKVRAAKDAGAEVFLTPAANCAEAQSAKVDGITLLKVNTLSEAVSQLHSYNNGGHLTTCGD